MARNYFENYPTTTYKKPTSDSFASGLNFSIDVSQVDLYLKFKVKDAILNNASLFYPYRWKDSDTPWTLARSYYGNEQFHWVVFYSNNAFDYAYDFPLPFDEFSGYLSLKYKQNVIDDVYGGNSTTYNALSKDQKYSVTRTYLRNKIHHYEIDGQFEVDIDTFNAYLGERRIVSYYDFEDEANEAKRNIRILDNDFLQNIKKEFLTQMSEINALRLVEGS